MDIFAKDLNDDAPPALLITLEANQFMTQWPSDSLIVFERGEAGVRDLWILDLSNPDEPEARPYLTSEADLERISISPDGTLAAYRSDESGIDQIYIRSFPDPGERTVVSQGRGHVPFWSPDGRTLYYGIAGGTTAAARLQLEPVPVVLSTDTLAARSLGTEPFPGSALHPDGDRFILAGNPTGGASPEPDARRERLVLVQNLSTLLRERLGGN